MTAPVAVSFKTTAAFGTAAPVESVTVPLIDPVVEVWATPIGNGIRLAAIRLKTAAKVNFRCALLIPICIHPPHPRSGGTPLLPPLCRFCALGEVNARSKPIDLGGERTAFGDDRPAPPAE
jgi:hypothetical protein